MNRDVELVIDKAIAATRCIDGACLLNNIDVHMSNTSITLSTTAVAEGFRCYASVPIVTFLSLNRVVFIFQ